ncbi:DNA-binding response regulator [Nautilia profundicola AmH]|uniref:DNA-binding response regulator n=1 Tax=Nautilia profundicola (strain ATCC BAA-1463 / DSM 18972 / AmH) TaxID=598659 RepID=B9L855_NAUPA|nr:response regulator transcription factor [Nautilia profundicola]ACM92798.1 DNA-binding response regulator [Nautilia profundicola AmH]
MKRKILIVEDDVSLNETVKEFLELNGFESVSVYDGDSALSRAYEESFDIILLDVKLPGMNGFDVAKEIRKFSDTPIIFITSLDSEKDIEKGFLSGGDDYIRKPFSLKELKLRIDAILRRMYGNSEKVDLGEGFEFDVKSMELLKNGEPVHLKTKVAKLLNLFIKHRGEVLDKEKIFSEIYDYEETPNEASLRTFVKTLRSILGNDKIETIKDVGYKFVG